MRWTILAISVWLLSCASPPGALAQDEPDPAGPPSAAENSETGESRNAEEGKTVAWLGVAVDEVDALVSEQLGLQPRTGLTVEAVVPGSPADKAGLQQHDILAKLDDQLLVVPRQLEILIHFRSPQSSTLLTCVREGRSLEIPVVLGERQVRRRTRDSSSPFFVEAREIDNDNLRVSLRSREHNIVVESRPGGERYASVTRNPEGEVLFQGLVTTEAQREKIPADLRAKIEKLGVMKNGKWVWQFDLDPDDRGAEERRSIRPGTRSENDE